MKALVIGLLLAVLGGCAIVPLDGPRYSHRPYYGHPHYYAPHPGYYPHPY